MSTVSATLQPASDGSIHLPVPPELQGSGKLRVVAWLEPAAGRLSSVGAGNWALQARGIARPLPDTPPEDSRLDFLRQKFGAH